MVAGDSTSDHIWCWLDLWSLVTPHRIMFGAGWAYGRWSLHIGSCLVLVGLMVAGDSTSDHVWCWLGLRSLVTPHQIYGVGWAYGRWCPHIGLMFGVD